MEETTNKFLDQALATAMNYYKTGRSNKAIEVVSQIKKINPDSIMAQEIMFYIAFGGPRTAKVISFMGDWWGGESLEGKSIQVFCDQGMGDTINLLRYLKVMKDKWNCKIVLNNYAFYSEMARLMTHVDYVDEFTQLHAKCDYYTNILSVPALLNELAFDFYYPTHWVEVMKKEIPNQDILCSPKPLKLDAEHPVGLAWRSNLENPIGQKKSIDISRFAILEDGVNDLYSVIPNAEHTNMMVSLPLQDLYDTAMLIASLDVVVSVDTVTLHLAGAMGKKTLALLPFEADPRWGQGNTTVWYPSVELYRQPASLDWSPVIEEVKERLVSLRALR